MLEDASKVEPPVGNFNRHDIDFQRLLIVVPTGVFPAVTLLWKTTGNSCAPLTGAVILGCCWPEEPDEQATIIIKLATSTLANMISTSCY